MTKTKFKTNWKFILLIILGIIPLIAMGFTIPRFCMPFFEDVVYRNKKFEVQQLMNEEGEYEYALSLELKYDRDISILMLSFEFDNGSTSVTKQVTLSNFKKSGKEIFLKFTLKGDDYKVSKMKYKTEEQDEFRTLYSGEILKIALINAGLFVFAMIFFVSAYKLKKKMIGSSEESDVDAQEQTIEILNEEKNQEEKVEYVEDLDSSTEESVGDKENLEKVDEISDAEVENDMSIEDDNSSNLETDDDLVKKKTENKDDL